MPHRPNFRYQHINHLNVARLCFDVGVTKDLAAELRQSRQGAGNCGGEVTKSAVKTMARLSCLRHIPDKNDTDVNIALESL